MIAAIIALAFGVYTRINPPQWKHDFGMSSPAAVVPSVMSLLTDGVKLYAAQAYRSAHCQEIMRNLEVVDVSESSDHAIAFFRYSIGTDIYREAYWLGKVNGKWYYNPNLSTYSENKPADVEWFEKMEEKKEKWEKESAKPKF